MRTCNDVLDSTREASDVITDYVAYRERIDLSAIDAKSATAANDAFTFVGKEAFSGAGGEVRYLKNGSSTTVQANVDGDRIADFQLVLHNVVFVQAADLIFEGGRDFLPRRRIVRQGGRELSAGRPAASIELRPVPHR